MTRLFCALLCCSFSSLGLLATATAGLSGYVRDREGRPLASASVRLQSSGQGAAIRVTCDRFGFFKVDPAPGEYSLRISKDGYLAHVVDVDLQAGRRTRIEITLEATSQLKIHDRIMVVGDPSGVDAIPGSAHYLGKEELAPLRNDFDDIHQLLRRVPGVNVQEEEGYGLRPNIGFRGSGVERSAKITLMEDGVLIAPAPYAAPAAYYFPTSGRMDAIEVRKGSSQIKHGPRTNGGALNLISMGIPSELSAEGAVAGGPYGTTKFHFRGGDSSERFGWALESYRMANDGHKELDGGGDTGFELTDYLAKVRFNSGPQAEKYQELELKFGFTEQLSRETYLGLTDSDFRANPYRRYVASAPDEFRGRHRQIQARHFVALSPRLDLTTTVYRNDFRRNWYKLQSVQGVGLAGLFEDQAGFSQELAIVRGADSSADALKYRANNRKYYAAGLQSVLGFELSEGARRHSLQFGFRFHRDQEDRFQHEDGYQMASGRPRLTSLGAPGSQSNRIGDAEAWAFFVQDTIRWKGLSVTPGLRHETIDLTRTDFSATDPRRSEPTGVRKNDLSVWIPGVGINLDVTPRLSFFGGVHKGFSPPGPGSRQETRAENSINYELGVRLNRRPLKASVAAFFNDYDNLLGADTLSAGGSGEGDLFNGGRARVAGIEAAAGLDLGALTDSGLQIPLDFSYTLTEAQFRGDFSSDFEPWGDVRWGDELPYLPRHQLAASLGLGTPRWHASASAFYVGRMRTIAGQGPIPGPQSIDPHPVINLSGEYRLPMLDGERTRATLFISLRNLFDREYVVARRPAGARPGLPRTLMGGIRFRLGK